MSTVVRRWAVGALLMAGMVTSQTAARAQTPAQLNPFNFRLPINPSGQAGPVLLPPGMTLNGYLATLQAQARAAAQLPFALYGYSAQPNPSVYIPPSAPLANPYLGNPYAPVTSPYVNPYTPAADAYSNPYTALSNPYTSAYNNPYMYGGYGYGNLFGGTLMGQADVMRAYGDVITKQEMARIMR